MKYIFSFMASLLLLAGCSGDFLDKEPTDSVSSDEVGAVSYTHPTVPTIYSGVTSVVPAAL